MAACCGCILAALLCVCVCARAGARLLRPWRSAAAQRPQVAGPRAAAAAGLPASRRRTGGQGTRVAGVEVARGGDLWARSLLQAGGSQPAGVQGQARLRGWGGGAVHQPGRASPSHATQRPHIQRRAPAHPTRSSARSCARPLDRCGPDTRASARAPLRCLASRAAASLEAAPSHPAPPTRQASRAPAEAPPQRWRGRRQQPAWCGA
jgi:hypothetical protein